MITLLYVAVAVLTAALGLYAVVLIAAPAKALTMLNSINRRSGSGTHLFRLPLDSRTSMQYRLIGMTLLLMIAWISISSFASQAADRSAARATRDRWEFSHLLGLSVMFTAAVTSAVHPQFFIRAWKDHIDPALLNSARFELILRLMGWVVALSFGFLLLSHLN